MLVHKLNTVIDTQIAEAILNEFLIEFDLNELLKVLKIDEIIKITVNIQKLFKESPNPMNK